MASDTEQTRRPVSSPRARRLARHLGVDWSALTGTGAGGRIRERDIRNQAALTAPQVDEQRAAVMTADIDAAPLLRLIETMRRHSRPGEPQPTAFDVLCKASAAALMLHSALRPGDEESAPGRVNVAFSVFVQSILSYPVVVGVERLSLRELVARRLDLIDLARARRLDHDQPATLAVTDLSQLGVGQFAPPLPAPAVASVGVGRIVRQSFGRPSNKANGDQQVESGQEKTDEQESLQRAAWTVSLGYDAERVPLLAAGRFLAELRRLMEQPDWMLAGV